MRQGFRKSTPAWICTSIMALAGAPALAGTAASVAGSAIAAKGTAAGAAACVACHGAKGEGNAAAGFPRLAGLPAAYLASQLQNFAEEKRKNPVMAPVAKQLTPVERKAVADYYGALPATAAPAAAVAVPLRQTDTGEWLALRGRWENNLPACVQCHGPGGAGIGAAFPALAGQSSAYIAAQLHAFKSGARVGGPQDLMKVVASKLSDGDITAVATYFGGGKP